MSRLLTVMLALGMLCSASSCTLWRRVTGRQKVAVSDSVTVVTDPGKAIPDTSLVRTDTAQIPVPDPAQGVLVQSWLPVWNSQLAFSTFSGKAKMAYEGGGESHELNASICIERDRRIWVSITALLGIEVARALITPDTISVLFRLQKEVRVMPFSEAGQLLPVRADFATLQSLIIGGVLRTGYVPNAVTDSGDLITMSATGPEHFQEVRFRKSDTSISAQTLLSGNALLRAGYFNYNLIGGRRFAETRELQMSAGAGDMHRIGLEFNRVVFDEPVEMDFSIPSRYERK